MTDLYPWLQTSQAHLLQQLSVGRLPHALLFLGSPGLGKSQLMSWLAERLLCQQPTAEGACGFCKSCHLIEAGTHPDLLRLETEKSSIGVDLVRQVTQALSETAHQQGARVVIIKQAQLMTESAANALLKTLEEPGESCFLLLSADSKAQLLPTIISRCQSHIVTPPEEELALNWLQQQGSEATLAHLRLCRGAPLLAQEFVGLGYHQKLDLFLVRILALLKGSPASPELLSEAVNEMPHSFDWLCVLLLDLQKVTAGLTAKQLMFANHYPELAALAKANHYQCADWGPWLAKWKPVLQASGLNMNLQWQAMLCELNQMVSQNTLQGCS